MRILCDVIGERSCDLDVNTLFIMVSIILDFFIIISKFLYNMHIDH